MILVREVKQDDIDGLLALSKVAAEFHPGFLNLTTDKDQWKEKIKLSVDSFSDKLKNKLDAKYLFVAENTKTRKIVAMSMVAAQHGSTEVPHFYFEVGNEQKYSQTINTGFIHGTLKLKHDSNGPTEIGGLLVHPDYRNTEDKIGRQISFVRFLYMAMNKQKFKRRVIAELLPPLTKKNKSPLWEAIGRRFTNMEYHEADDLSSKNKEFILSLFPTGKIYTTFLPADARNAIGKVSKDTEPVLHMLKKIGFEYRNEIDPFDGGPHLTANIDDIVPIKSTKAFTYAGDKGPTTATQLGGLVTHKESKKFAALSINVRVQDHKVFFKQSNEKALSFKVGDPVLFMPYY